MDNGGMRVLVTGGLGALGSQVVDHLTRLGHETTVASRRTGVDLTTGAGLDAALEGVGAVVHTADATSAASKRALADLTVDGTRRVLEVAGRQPAPPHVVTISILGCAQVDFVYYRAKAAADQWVLASRTPATVVSATQFHSLAAFFARTATVGPVALGVRGMQIQPVDIAWVGQRMAEVAVGPLPAHGVRGPSLAGPDVLDVPTITRLLAEHAGTRPPRAVELPPVGALRGGFTDGSILAGPGTEIGGRSFEEWLAEQPRRLRGR